MQTNLATNDSLIKDLDLKQVPTEPGVYIFLDKVKAPIYVGKAKNLRNRVSSYFVSQNLLWTKTKKMLQNAKYIRFIPTNSEVEAFLLEADLIKKFKPQYNIQLKDDKSYVHVIVQDISLGNNKKLRKVFVGRLTGTRRVQGNIVKAIGPYIEAGETKKVLRALRRIFPYASCSKTKFVKQQKMGRPCLYGQIGLCPAPCVTGQVGHKKNVANINRLVRFLVKGQAGFIRELETQMKKYSKNLEYEKALEIRNTLEKFKELKSARIMPNQYAENPNLISDIYKARSEQIKELFKLEKTPTRIECYDISNIMGDWATASMVVSTKGKLDKDSYRCFRIKFTKGITDFGMMAEVLKRRAKKVVNLDSLQASSAKNTGNNKNITEKSLDNNKLLKNKSDFIDANNKLPKAWPKPDILLIDGGKGQVSSVLKAIQGTPLEDVLVVGIFKPNDLFVINIENYKKVTGKDLHSGTSLATGWYIIRPNKDVELGYEHLRELRDEAHRFAKKYHKKLRDSSVKKS